MALPRVLLISLGGTITMTPAAGGGIAPTLDAAALVAAVPALAHIAELETLVLAQLASPSLRFEQVLATAAAISEAFDRGCDGAVVVQGTDTIEETAFLLDTLLPQPQPVVVTGAMRGATAPGADGPANLLAAVTAAACPALRELGTLVVLNDEMHAARYVHKAHTTLPSAFASPGSGPLGVLAEGRVRLLQRPPRIPGLPLGDGAPRPVALLQWSLDDDGRLLNVLLELGYEGCVIAGLGAGHVPAHAVPALALLAARMPVVLCSRCSAGPAFRETYGYPGGERDLLARGLLPGGLLAPGKARLLLGLALRGIAPDDQLAARAAAARAFAPFQ